jgi:hypothetical protein
VCFGGLVVGAETEERERERGGGGCIQYSDMHPTQPTGAACPRHERTARCSVLEVESTCVYPVGHVFSKSSNSDCTGRSHLCLNGPCGLTKTSFTCLRPRTRPPAYWPPIYCDLHNVCIIKGWYLYMRREIRTDPSVPPWHARHRGPEAILHQPVRGGPERRKQARQASRQCWAGGHILARMKGSRKVILRVITILIIHIRLRAMQQQVHVKNIFIGRTEQ